MENFDVNKYVRGTIWWWKSGYPKKTANPADMEPGIACGARPVLIVSSNDRGNSPVVECLCITSKVKKKRSVNVELCIDGTYSLVMCNQHITININNLGDYLGMVSDEKMKEVDRAMMEALGLNKYVHNYYNWPTYKIVDDLTNERVEKRTVLNEYNKIFNETKEDKKLAIKEEKEEKETKIRKPHSSGYKVKNTENMKRSKSNKWTLYLADQFFKDIKTLSEEDILRKYQFTQRESIFKTKWYLKNKFKNEIEGNV